MSREKHITYLMNCTDDLCLCGVVANQIDLEKLSDDELATVSYTHLTLPTILLE